jgi:hypothetical protein
METEIPELELQQALQRFTTQFTDRVSQATEILERSSRRRVRDDALRANLLYVSSAMEIATGPVPAINLLDMFVFVRLGRAVLERHWLPEYGAEGTALGEAFARTDDEISALAGRSLGAERCAQLASIVDAWLADNPAQTRVEGIRLADFSEAAGAAVGARSIEVRGLLSSVKTATVAANQAFQLVERGLFLVHRLPFLWRLQARLGAREVLGDSTLLLTEAVQVPLRRLTSLARNGTLLGGAAAIVLWLRRSRARP